MNNFTVEKIRNRAAHSIDQDTANCAGPGPDGYRLKMTELQQFSIGAHELSSQQLIRLANHFGIPKV